MSQNQTEAIDLVIHLSAEAWDEYPSTKVFVNDIEIFQGKIQEPTKVTWQGNLPTNATNVIRIDLVDKKRNQTKIDKETSKILEDQLLVIDDIEIDGISVASLLHDNSMYYPDRTVNKDFPEKVARCIHLGYNGTWLFTFKTPVYLWLLENL